MRLSDTDIRSGNKERQINRTMRFGTIRIKTGGMLLAAALLLSGCGVQQAEENDADLSVVCTIFPQYDFVRAITGTDNLSVNCTMLLSPGEEVHSYEPSPQDMIRMQKADLLIYTGGENDVWIEDMLDSMGEDAPETFRLMDYVELVDEEVIEGMQLRGHTHEHEEGEECELEPDHDHDAEAHPEDHVHSEDEIHADHDHAHGEEAHDHADEHVWTSPVNAAQLCTAIAARMGELDPAHAEAYASNAEHYAGQLMELDAQFRTLVDTAARKEIVFGDRFPLVYFAKEYGLTYYAAFHGCSADAEASAATLSFLVDKVRTDRIPVVFSIELSNGRIADVISEETGAEPLVFNTCHNLTKTEFEQGATYVDLMRKNLEVLQKALN